MYAHVTGTCTRVAKDRQGGRSEDGAGLSERSGRFAVADGASETTDARLWALHLAGSYLHRPPPLDVHPPVLYDWFVDCARTWELLCPPPDPTDWRFNGFGASPPAAAAFVALQFAPTDLRWQAVAVGDCCLFRIRPPGVTGNAGRRTTMDPFPISDPSAMDDHPDLVSSDLRSLRHLAVGPGHDAADGPIKLVTGQAWPGEIYLLASDAVAHWLLRLAREYSPEVCRRFVSLPRPERERRLRIYQDSGYIRSDDLTLVAIRIHPADG